MNDYLWDPSRESDPEVKAFEERLAPLRREAPPLPALPDRSERLPLAWRRAFVAAPLLLAASLALAAALAHLSRGGGWEVRWEGDRTTRLARGEWLETGGATVRLAVGRIGTLTLEPGTRLRLVSDSPRDQRVALARGTVHAVIQAPPRRFFVETPVTTAIDLGCAYTFSTDEAGNGLLRVRAGWVAFERRTARGAEEVVVPAGASCRVSAARGPGLDYVDELASAGGAWLVDRTHGEIDEIERFSALLTSILESPDQAREQGLANRRLFVSGSFSIGQNRATLSDLYAAAQAYRGEPLRRDDLGVPAGHRWHSMSGAEVRDDEIAYRQANAELVLRQNLTAG